MGVAVSAWVVSETVNKAVAQASCVDEIQHPAREVTMSFLHSPTSLFLSLFIVTAEFLFLYGLFVPVLFLSKSPLWCIPGTSIIDPSSTWLLILLSVTSLVDLNDRSLL